MMAQLSLNKLNKEYLNILSLIELFISKLAQRLMHTQIKVHQYIVWNLLKSAGIETKYTIGPIVSQ